jgi:hypothetical protein
MSFRVIPTIEKEYAARRIFKAIMQEELEVHIWWYLYYIRIVVELLPMRVSHFLMRHLISQGMQTFVGHA